MISTAKNDHLSQACEGLADVNSRLEETIDRRLGIVFTAVGPNFLCAEMPVNEGTKQPFGLLHGGASMVLAESLGSLASWLLVKGDGGIPVGIEISGSHVKSVSSGFVTGTCTPLRIGRNLHFWRIQIRNRVGDLCCEARLTVTIRWPGNRDRSV